MERLTYDRSKFFNMLKLQQEYQVGDEFFILQDQKIKKGHIHKVKTIIYNQWTVPAVEITVEFELQLNVNGNVFHVYESQLYKTREEVADKFLQDNDVPSELLKVLKQEKPRTTVADLIEKLQTVNPETELGSEFDSILTKISRHYLRHLCETTSEYWDCECEKEYIHSTEEKDCKICGKRKEDSPASRYNELKPENMHKG